MNSINLQKISLNVANLVKESKFYKELLLLEEIEKTEGRLLLGFHKNGFLELVEDKSLEKPMRSDAGLYHFALLYSTQGFLAKTLKNIIENSPEYYGGASDHLVSEAFYLNDPEGNGIELYFDRPAATWQWENGQIRMGSAYIDVEDYIERHNKEKNGTVQLGHIHLKVGDIVKAQEFYVDTLGFDIVAKLPSALFVSMDKYHHHLGMNIWESDGADKRIKTLGLNYFEFELKTENYNSLIAKLKSSPYEFNNKNGQLEVSDPWDNKLIITPLL